jgi:hypothetical protein
LTAAAQTPAPAPKDVVHILSAGFTLCPLGALVPSAWPPGHRWVRLAERTLASCPECLHAVEHPPTRERAMAMRLRLAADEHEKRAHECLRDVAEARALATELETDPPPTVSDAMATRAAAIFRRCHL